MTTATAAGFVGSSIAADATVHFAGPTASVTFAAGQKLFVVAEGMLGAGGSPAGSIDFDVGYQQGTGAVNFASGGNFLDLPSIAANTRQNLSVSWIFAPAAGTYNVGLAVRVNGTVALTNNDWVHVTVMVLA